MCAPRSWAPWSAASPPATISPCSSSGASPRTRPGRDLLPASEYPVAMVSGVPVVAAPGEIDITNADGPRAALAEAAAHRSATVVVDMTRTQFCDTAGIHVLVTAHKRARGAGGQLRLVI